MNWKNWFSKQKPEKAESIEDEFAAKQYVLASSQDEIRSQIITDITTYSPDLILITGGYYDFILEGLKASKRQIGISKYEILCNKDISLSWLCKTAAEIRANGRKTILMSNYPRETDPPLVRYRQEGRLITVEMPVGTSLQLCDKQDESTRLAIYLIGMFAEEYITNLYTSQAQGREQHTRLQMLVEGPDLSRLVWSEEAEKVRTAAEGIEQQDAIRELSKRIDEKPEIVYLASVIRGGILVD